MVKSNFVPNPAKIKVVGAGGGGCNAISQMVREDIQGVDFIGVNTDAQALLLTEAPTRVQIGEKLTKGLGAGGRPEIGRKAAEESRDEIKNVVSGADMVFITAGMGGGTGTGSAPLIAELAKESGALTIAIITKPFAFEGAPRRASAEEGINELVDKVDTLIIIPNERLLSVCDHKALMQEAFLMADKALLNGVKAISEVITVPGMINLDFADIKAIMEDAGPAWMSIGVGSGQNRAVDAAKAALDSPLLDVSVDGARGVLFVITGGDDLTLHEVNEAAEVIRGSVDVDANIIFGVVFDHKLKDAMKITLVATGFASRLGPGLKDEEIRRILKTLKDDGDMDIPAFMRQSSSIINRVPVIKPVTRTQTSPYTPVKTTKAC
ncbi:MAG: cell division protein FtsZ [Dehalococcoidia bacterium]|nr:cell division protein FtsZ [Dehalococcoidia bacterium]